MLSASREGGKVANPLAGLSGGIEDGGQLGKRAKGARVQPVGRQFGGGQQGEAPFGKPRVRQGQHRALDHKVAGRQQVEVERAGTPAHLEVAASAGLLLEPPAGHEDLERMDVDLEQDCSVQEIRLGRTERGAAPQARCAEQSETRRESRGRPDERRRDVAAVAAKSDQDLHAAR